MLEFDTLKWYKGCVTLALSTSNGLGGTDPWCSVDMSVTITVLTHLSQPVLSVYYDRNVNIVIVFCVGIKRSKIYRQLFRFSLLVVQNLRYHII